jgi:hypothetical protein
MQPLATQFQSSASAHKPFAQCLLSDLAYEICLWASSAGGSALDTSTAEALVLSFRNAERNQAVLLRHPLVRGSSGLVCTTAAHSKQAWCSMLQDLCGSAGVAISDAALLRVYLVCKECAKRGRVRLSAPTPSSLSSSTLSSMPDGACAQASHFPPPIAPTRAPSAAPAAAAAAPAINFATEWLCERGLVWPKAVDYMTQCPKGHTLTACACVPRCHVCGDDAAGGGGMSCTQGCSYGVCAACLTTLKQQRAAAAGGGGGGFPSLGVSAEFLQAFKVKWGQTVGGWSTEQVCQQLIKTVTCRSRGSVCDDLVAAGSSHVGEATIFLSHTWGNLFLDTVDAALGAVQAAGAFIWFDVFSTSQHSAIDKPSSWWMSTFRDAIAKMGSLAMVLQPWDDPLALKRAW